MSRVRFDAATRLHLLLGIAGVVGSILLPALLGSAYWTHNFLVVNLFVAVAVLQNMLLADAGQVSFGQGAVFGLSAFTVGIVAGLWGHSYAVGFLAGVFMAIVLGLLFALPALRVQGYYLGFVTLSAAVVFPEMLVAFNDLTNGINGITRAVPALTAPIGLGLTWIAVMVMALAVAALLFHATLRATRLGRQIRVAAVSPEAAMALGINPGALRFIAFTIAATGAGLAGALYVPVLGFVSPYAFRVDLSIFFFFSVVVGGNGQLIGPVIGVWILYLVPNALLADLANYRLLGYGFVALLIMLAFPDGVVGTIEALRRRRRLRAQITGISVDRVLAWAGSRPRPAAQGEAITVRGARKTFGSLAALDGVDLAVVPGSVHGLVGPNGSGKTTLLNVISGFIALNAGSVAINGTDTSRAPAYRVARLGVGRTFQTPRVLEEMSIWENLEVGADVKGDDNNWLLALLAPFRAEWAENRPELLAHAQRRVLEVLRTVAGDADILLLDEPAAGLSAAERRDFARLVRFLSERLGKTVLLVEHDLALVWKVADRITVLDAGQVIAEGPPDTIAADPRVRALFIGGGDA
ncbi:MAG: ATP-binding cassette domain-containing protein [Alphaproteobacteria bacterium]|nr:ATP-binding cassette domain-containing protein [Alphaproteobacteria bacterium]